MGLETYKELMGKLELSQVIQAGLDQIKKWETITEEQMMESLNRLLGNKCIH